MPELTPEELELIDALADVFNRFNNLPVQHPMHKREFATGIHQLQRLIMSRPISRHYGWVKDTSDDA